jgi:hypothetical protein
MKMTATDSPKLLDVSLDHDNVAARLKLWSEKIAFFSMFATVPSLLAANAQYAGAMDAGEQRAAVGQTSQLPPAWWKNGRRNFRTKPGAIQPSPLVGGDNCPGKAIPGGKYTALAPYTDTGDTTGANNSVNFAYCYFCGYYSVTAQGPDVVYSFRLIEAGPNANIQVIPTNPTANKPLVYVTAEEPGSYGCPTETDVYYAFGIDNTRRANSNGTALIRLCQGCSWQRGRIYVFVDSQLDDSLGAGAYTIKLEDVTVGPAHFGNPVFDLDGDGKSDPAVFRSSDSTWYTNRSAEGPAATRFGYSSDVLAPGDFDGDGKTDIAIFRDGAWWWINSATSTATALQFGLPYAIPVPADYTGDGRDEIAVFQNGTWWAFDLSNGQVSSVTPFQYQYWREIPVVGDFDGDGEADQAAFNPYYWDGTNSYPIWLINRSSKGPMYVRWGGFDDRPVPADYDGDGKTDFAVFRPSNATWYINRSTEGFAIFPFGLANDQLTPADYDGDGRADPAVFRNGIWYQMRSSGGIAYINWGLSGDFPVQSVYPVQSPF